MQVCKYTKLQYKFYQNLSGAFCNCLCNVAKMSDDLRFQIRSFLREAGPIKFDEVRQRSELHFVGIKANSVLKALRNYCPGRWSSIASFAAWLTGNIGLRVVKKKDYRDCSSYDTILATRDIILQRLGRWAACDGQESVSAANQV